MDNVFGPKTDPATVVQKVVIEQVTFGVLYNLAILTYRAFVVEGEPLPFSCSNALSVGVRMMMTR